MLPLAYFTECFNFESEYLNRFRSFTNFTHLYREFQKFCVEIAAFSLTFAQWKFSLLPQIN